MARTLSIDDLLSGDEMPVDGILKRHGYAEVASLPGELHRSNGRYSEFFSGRWPNKCDYVRTTDPDAYLQEAKHRDRVANGTLMGLFFPSLGVMLSGLYVPPVSQYPELEMCGRVALGIAGIIGTYRWNRKARDRVDDTIQRNGYALRNQDAARAALENL